MSIPMPHDPAGTAKGPLTRTGGHLGLYFDKFCNTWRDTLDGWTLKADKVDNRRGEEPTTGKHGWLRRFKGPTGQGDVLRDQGVRILALVDSQKGHSQVCKSESPFVTGLGRTHPVENGLAFHPTLSTPFLAGSGVKGMTRAWATTEGRPGVERVFGSPEGGVGTVIFLDACPVEPVSMQIDVMTPHYSPWYQSDGTTPPADWHSPNPIPYLVQGSGARYLFAVLPRHSHDPQHVADAAQAMSWLLEALEWQGAGAKTAVGYGHFLPDEIGERSLRGAYDKWVEANLSPAERWPLRLKAADELQMFEWFKVHIVNRTQPLDAEETAVLKAALSATPAAQSWARGRTVEPNLSINMSAKKLKEWVASHLDVPTEEPSGGARQAQPDATVDADALKAALGKVEAALACPAKKDQTAALVALVDEAPSWPEAARTKLKSQLALMRNKGITRTEFRKYKSTIDGK